MSDLINSSLRELSAALAKKEVSAVELARQFLDRIDRLIPVLAWDELDWTEVAE